MLPLHSPSLDHTETSPTLRMRAQRDSNSQQVAPDLTVVVGVGQKVVILPAAYVDCPAMEVESLRALVLDNAEGHMVHPVTLPAEFVVVRHELMMVKHAVEELRLLPPLEHPPKVNFPLPPIPVPLFVLRMASSILSFAEGMWLVIASFAAATSSGENTLWRWVEMGESGFTFYLFE